MGAKATYNCLTLAIYISRPELLFLLKQEARLIPVYLGKSKTPVGNVHVIIEPATAKVLEQMYNVELTALQKGKDEWLDKRLGLVRSRKDKKDGKRTSPNDNDEVQT